MNFQCVKTDQLWKLNLSAHNLLICWNRWKEFQLRWEICRWILYLVDFTEALSILVQPLLATKTVSGLLASVIIPRETNWNYTVPSEMFDFLILTDIALSSLRPSLLWLNLGALQGILFHFFLRFGARIWLFLNLLSYYVCYFTSKHR